MTPYNHAAVMAAIKKTCEEWLAKNWQQHNKEEEK